MLSGEPGIGKSRITETLHERLADVPHTRLRYQCSPHHTNSALYPVIRQLEFVAGLAPDDTPERKLDKLGVLLGQSAHDVAEVMPLLAALPSIPTGERCPALSMTPERQRERTLEVLTDQFVGLAEVQGLSDAGPACATFRTSYRVHSKDRA
ncbi:MAG: hypothetical protein ACE5Q3_03130 [Alphaproteobacteria bacterium]